VRTTGREYRSIAGAWQPSPVRDQPRRAQRTTSATFALWAGSLALPAAICPRALRRSRPNTGIAPAIFPFLKKIFDSPGPIWILRRGGSRRSLGRGRGWHGRSIRRASRGGGKHSLLSSDICASRGSRALAARFRREGKPCDGMFPGGGGAGSACGGGGLFPSGCRSSADAATVAARDGAQRMAECC